MSRAERRDVESALVLALSRLPGGRDEGRAGQYYPLGSLSKEDEAQLTQVSGVTS